MSIDRLEGRRNPLNVLFLVRALTVGGAERQLVETARGMAKRGHCVAVAVFYRVQGPLEQKLTEVGIEVVDLRKGGRWDVWAFLRRLRAVVKARGIDAIYAYLPSANIIAALAGLASSVAVVWGLRSTEGGGGSYDWLGHTVAASQRVFALRADAIVVNSAAGLRYHADRGLPASRMHLVRNGLDTSVFRFDSSGRKRWRDKLGLLDDEVLVLLAGRHDPIKGINVMLEACRTLPVRMVISGTWVEPYTSQLRAQAESIGVGSRVHWLDQQDDMVGLMSAADIVGSASFREGTSNVLIEAAATGALLVGTSVGDTADLVGDDTLMAQPGDAASLGRALEQAIGRVVSRRRQPSPVVERYSMETMLVQTEAILLGAVRRRRGGAQ